MNKNVGKKKSKRIFYFDALRAMAILSVIVYHVSMTMRYMVLGEVAPIPSLSWIICDSFFNYFRFGVDLFLMLAGALSLGRVWTIRDFLGRRLPRIVEPYLFWIFVICMSLLLIQYFHPEILRVVDSYTVSNISVIFLKAFQSKSGFFYSYWFFWMILGTYLIMPIANKWLLHSDLNEAEYFLVFWLITSLFDFTLFMEFPIKLTYFTSPLGMVILGYYLRHTKRKIFNNIYFPVFLLILSFILEMGLSIMFSTPKGMYKFDRYSITMVMKVTGLFLLFKNIDTKKLLSDKIPRAIKIIIKKVVGSLAKHSYGLYLIHLAVLSIILRILKYKSLYTPTHFKLIFFGLAISTIIISWAIMAILNKVPYVNNVIGSK